ELCVNRRGSLTFFKANMTSQAMPALADNKPEAIVNVRIEITRNDQPAIAVEKLQMSISAARSVVETRPRRLSGTSRIKSVSWTANSTPSVTREMKNIRQARN